MSKFQQVMAKNPPHVAVKYVRGETREQDQYSYGVVGSMPLSQLIGFIVRVQAELAFRNPEPCVDNLCIIAFDPATNKMQWFVDSKIPVDALVGTLEMIKCVLVDSQMSSMMEAAQKRVQTGLVSSDGKPILRSK